MKRNLPCSAFLLTILFLIFSCSSSDDSGGLSGTDLSISELQGSWTVTSLVFGKLCDPGVDCPVEEVDVIEEGATATLTIQGNGRFTILSAIPGGGSETITGQMSFDEDLLVLEFDDVPGEEEYYGIQLSNNGNTLAINGNAEYDFDGDGTDEPANLNLVCSRN